MPNYNPYGYNYNNPYNQFQTQSQNTYAYVNGLEGAKAFQVLANQTVLLIDMDNPIIYMKSANAMGQSNIQCFKIAQIKESDIKTINVDPNTPYVLKSDLDGLVKRLETLENSMKKEVGGTTNE